MGAETVGIEEKFIALRAMLQVQRIKDSATVNRAQARRMLLQMGGEG